MYMGINYNILFLSVYFDGPIYFPYKPVGSEKSYSSSKEPKCHYHQERVPKIQQR